MIEDFDQPNPDEGNLDENQSEQEGQQTPQEFLAEEERKISLRRLLVIGAVIFLAIFYFVWANYLNFGYLEVIGKAPFSVTITGEINQECPSSPCEIKLKRGEKIVSVYKSGFTAESIETEVVLWGTVAVKPIFIIEPSIKEVTEIPEGSVAPQEVKYKITYDQTHNNYALVKDGDGVDFAVSYFGGKVESPFIIGSENAVLVIENMADGKGFYINTVTKERQSLEKTFVSATKGLVSPNGRYFLIETSAKTLFVADRKSFSIIRDSATFDSAFWTLKNTLVLAYLQREKDSDGVVTEKYIFDEYNPMNGEQRTFFTTDLMLGDLLPKNIKVNPSTNTVFFESGEKKYEIIF